MSFIRAIIRFLCDQKKWLVYAGIILSQVLVAADIETFILSLPIERGRAFMGIIATELIAGFVILPSLLLLFRIIARFSVLLGTMRAIMLTIAVIVVEELLTRTTQEYMFVAPILAFDIALWTLMSGAMLFIVKGNEPLFQKETISEPLVQKDAISHPDIFQSRAVSATDEPSSEKLEVESLSLRDHVKLFIQDDLKMHLPFLALALIFVGLFVFNQPRSHSRIDHQENDEQQPTLAMSKENTEQGRGKGVITPELAESMGSGSKFDFSGCIGKTITECIESATYAKTYSNGIEFDLQISRAESCGPQARFLAVLGPKGVATSGCWVKNGEEVNLWIFTPPDANGNYTKVSGPTVRSVEVMPYYKTHNLPAVDVPVSMVNAAASTRFPESGDFDETDACLAGLKQFTIRFTDNFTDANRQAIKKNCSSKRKEWLCFINKAGGGHISMAEENQLEIACNLND